MRTVLELSKALKLSTRTVERELARGMPRPAEGQSLKDWAKDAKKWRADNRGLPGRPKSLAKNVLQRGKADDPLDRLREANAKRAELALAKEEGRLHSKDECERDDAQRWAQVMNALRMLGPRFARRLGNMDPAPTPDFVQEVYDEEMALAVEALKRGAVS